MAAEDESIGGIRVDIVGDYSRLQADIDTASSIAAAGGAEIASALNAGAEGADALSGAITAAATGMGSFEAQIQALVDTGSTLAEALATVGTGAAGIASGVQEAGTAAASAAQQMLLFDEAVQVPYADAAGQLNLFATQLEPIAGAAESAAQSAGKLAESTTGAGAASGAAAGAEDQFKNSTKEAGEAAEQGSVQVDTLLKKLLEVGGITLSIAAIKEFGEACVESAADAERMGEGIAFMRGNIGDTAQEISKLRDLAQQLSEPFEQVGKAAQTFAFLKFSADDAAAAMQVADDASKASGRDFNTLANSLANISMSVTLMPRTLKQLGIEAKDLSETMGMSFDDIKKAWKGMDESAKLDALMASMSAVGGASKAMADDTKSNLTRFSNEWDRLKSDVGKFVTPFVEQMMPAVGFAMKAVATAAIEVVGGIEALVHVLAGIVATALDAVPALGKAILLTLAGNVSEASVVAANAISTVTSDVKNIWMQYKADADSTTAAVKKLWVDQAEAAKASSSSQSKSWRDTARAAALAALAAAAAAAELKKETKEVESFAKSIAPALSEAGVSYQDYLASLLEGGKTASSVLRQLTQDISKGEAEAAKMSGAPKAAMEEWLAKLREAQKTMEDFAAQDAEGKAWSDILDKRAAYAAKVAEEAQKINDQMVADQQKADLMVEQGELTHQEKLLEIQRTTAAEQAKAHSITAFEQLSIDQDLDARENALAQAALQRELRILDESAVAQTDYASKREAIMLRIQALQDKTDGKAQVDAIHAQTVAWNVLGIESDKALQTQITEANTALAILVKQHAAQGDIYAGEEKSLALQIQLAERSGADATAQIVQMQNVKIQQQALSDQTRLMGDLYVGVTNDILKGWSEIGKSIADNIIDEKDWGKTMVDVGKQIGKTIMEDIVGTYFKALKNAILGVNSDTNDLSKSFVKLGQTISNLFGGGQKVGAEGVIEGSALPAGQAIDEAGNVLSPSGGAQKSLGGSATSALGGGGGTLGIVNAISGIASVIEQAFGLAQMSHLISTAGKIEENTRRMDLVFEKFAQTDEWNRFDQIFGRMGEVWRDMRTGFQSVVDAITTGIGAAAQQAASDAASARDIFRNGFDGVESAVRGRPRTDNRTGEPPPNQPPWNPYPVGSPLHDIWDGLTKPTAMPSLPTPGAVHVLSTPSSATYAASSTTNSNASIGTVNFIVSGASDPRAVVRSVADSLKILSPKFSVFGT